MTESNKNTKVGVGVDSNNSLVIEEVKAFIRDCEQAELEVLDSLNNSILTDLLRSGYIDSIKLVKGTEEGTEEGREVRIEVYLDESLNLEQLVLEEEDFVGYCICGETSDPLYPPPKKYLYKYSTDVIDFIVTFDSTKQNHVTELFIKQAYLSKDKEQKKKED